MAKICPLTDKKVLYLECNECEEKRACMLGLLEKDTEEKDIKSDDCKYSTSV